MSDTDDPKTLKRLKTNGTEKSQRETVEGAEGLVEVLEWEAHRHYCYCRLKN